MEDKTKTAIIATVILIVIAIVVGVFIVKSKPATKDDAAQTIVTPSPTEVTNEVAAEEKPVMKIEEVIALPSNELISMEEAAKTGTEINAKIAEGTITKEEGEKQLQILRSHIAPPTPNATK